MPPRKRVLAMVKIQLDAGAATPAPPVGTALGPHGVQTMEFCKQYNAATESQRGTVVPVDITIYEDRTFTFVLKTPPTPVLLRQAAGHRQGVGDLGPRAGGDGHRRPAGRDRQGQAARPQHRRPRGGQAPGGGHGPLDGHRRRRLTGHGTTPSDRRHDPARQEVHSRRSARSTARSCTASSRRSTW